MNFKERAKGLKRDIPAIYIALTEHETPLYAKVFAGLTIAYALSPIDLIPDFIPILGYVDDVLILPFLIWLTVRLVPDPVWKESQEKAVWIWQSGKPKRWYFAIPIILFWSIIVGIIIKTKNPGISGAKRLRCRSNRRIIDSPTPFSALYDCL